MPVLPIADDQGRLLPLAHHILFAVTAYPSDIERREEFIASSLASLTAGDPETLRRLASEPWFLPALHRAPKPDRVERDAAKSSVSAWPCGEMLLLMLGARHHHGELDITPTSAVAVLEKFHRPGLTRTGKQVTASRSKIWKAWTTFRPVAHFHAARQVWMDYYGEDKTKNFADWQVNHVTRYLAVSTAILKVAISAGFLTHGEAWHVPESLALPPMKFTPGALQPEMLALFQDYKPEHSKKPDHRRK